MFVTALFALIACTKNEPEFPIEKIRLLKAGYEQKFDELADRANELHDSKTATEIRRLTSISRQHLSAGELSRPDKNGKFGPLKHDPCASSPCYRFTSTTNNKLGSVARFSATFDTLAIHINAAYAPELAQALILHEIAHVDQDIRGELDKEHKEGLCHETTPCPSETEAHQITSGVLNVLSNGSYLPYIEEVAAQAMQPDHGQLVVDGITFWEFDERLYEMMGERTAASPTGRSHVTIQAFLDLNWRLIDLKGGSEAASEHAMVYTRTMNAQSDPRVETLARKLAKFPY